MKSSLNEPQLNKMLALRSAESLSWLRSMLLFALLLSPVKALYFYMDGTAQRCFYEELPKDTLVVGKDSCPIDSLPYNAVC